jgi:protein-L-isoaspartate(D-aspartate) O-methyltransferase
MTSSEQATVSAKGHSEAARQAMIDSQLRPSGVNATWVLSAMAATPRENFVPADARDFAYIDRAVPLGGGRFLAPPLFHGRLLEEAAPTAADRVLVVTSGSDYLAALVRPVVGSVTAIDARDAIGHVPGGGHTLILIDGAAETVPEALTAALADNGRIVGGVVINGLTRLAAGRKVRGEVAMMPLADIAIPVLPELVAPRRWSF